MQLVQNMEKVTWKQEYTQAQEKKKQQQAAKS